MKSFIISTLAVSFAAADQVDSLITAIQSVLPQQSQEHSLKWYDIDYTYPSSADTTDGTVGLPSDTVNYFYFKHSSDIQTRFSMPVYYAPNSLKQKIVFE